MPVRREPKRSRLGMVADSHFLNNDLARGRLDDNFTKSLAVFREVGGLGCAFLVVACCRAA